jgi:hypothetical protein
MQLRLHPGQRHLVTADDRPFVWLGDTAWELFHRCDRDEAEHYLTTRARQGFNLVQAVALAELDGLRTPNALGDLPLHDCDPTRPNEAYFRHVDWIVQRANQLGIYVGLLPTWGDKWEKMWGTGPEIFDETNARIYGRWLGARYRDAGLVWVLGGDRPVVSAGKLAVLRAMAEGLRAGDGGAHLITLHPSGAQSSSWSVHAEPWLDFHMIQSSHDRGRANFAMIEPDWHRLPRRPVVEGEPGYEAHPNAFNHERGWLDHHDVRRQLYWAFLAGAAGYTYGCHAVWQMWQPPRAPVNGPRAPWKESLQLPGAAQCVHARRLFESRPWTELVPDQRLLQSDGGQGVEQIRVARLGGGACLIAYAPNGQRFDLDTTALTGSALRVWWYDPRTGVATAAGEVTSAARSTFQCPYDPAGRDWVLVLDDAAAGFGPPGGEAAQP